MKKNTISTLPDCFETVVAHDKIQEVLDQLKTTVTCNYGPKLVFVTGPTGVGKTTLIEAFKAYLQKVFEQDPDSDPQQSVPYGYCSVKVRGSGTFSWRDTYLQLLYSLGHPFTAELDKYNRSRPWERLETPPSLSPLSPSHAQRMTNDRLFRTFQKTTCYRKPKAIIMDEAHHLLQVGSAQSEIEQLEQLKYAADQTGVTHYLFGTYALIKGEKLNAQLIRRRQIIDFPRYTVDPQNTDDPFDGFTETVAQFNVDLERHCSVDLLEMVDELYAGSLGCVGVLRDWLFRAHSAAQESRRRITKSILRATVMDASDRLLLLEELREGEKQLASRENKETELRNQLGLLSVQIHDDTPVTGASSPTTPKKRTSKPKGKRRVGARKAHNDKVGVKNALGMTKGGS